MAAVSANGVGTLDREALRSSLFSSSTRRRILELDLLADRLEDHDISEESNSVILRLLFDTYPLYVDRASRQAVQRCLRIVFSKPIAIEGKANFLSTLKEESTKPGIAPANAFVLVEWCSILVQQLAGDSESWSTWGLDILLAHSQLLELCLGSGIRQSVKHSAMVVTRRALRKLFATQSLVEETLKALINALTTKSSGPTSRNAIFLGCIAGVCARSPTVASIFESLKKEYFAFYVREIVNSRTVVPHHIANGLHDFFRAFTTDHDLCTEIIPAYEKALLRSPEVVLNDLISPLTKAISNDIDFSTILYGKLLKPLLANIKSSNPSIRSGATVAFTNLVARCKDDTILERISDEILGPLKSSKVTVAEQRAIHAQMLAVIPSSLPLVRKIPQGLAPVASKEPNENAIGFEIAAIARHLTFGLTHGWTVDKAVIDTFKKGLADKRIPVRRIWALKCGEILWSIDEKQIADGPVQTFGEEIFSKLLDNFTEAAANPVAAAQNGLLTIAYIATAISIARFQATSSDKLHHMLKRTPIPKEALSLEPKPSYMLNHRAYTKVTGEEDLAWAVRALASTSQCLTNEQLQSPVGDSWAQAFLYLLSASNIQPTVRREATQTLAAAYVKNPRQIGTIIINGLWSWRQNIETAEKDTAAFAAKTGLTGLYRAVQSICLPPTEAEMIGERIDDAVLNDQLVRLLVLARPQLIPNVAWIDMCLRAGVDPGTLASKHSQDCMEEVKVIAGDEGNFPYLRSTTVRQAACDAAAELAFVAPETLTPMIVNLLEDDLDPKQLIDVGPTEAAIYRTPEGTAFVDVLASKSHNRLPDKNAKDYDTLKWEEELRAQLAQKKGQQKKLSSDEQAKINAQLAKESAIRREVSKVVDKLRRGVGIVKSLSTGPPSEANLWMGTAVNRLLAAINAGAGLLLGDGPVDSYLACSERVSSRLGPMRPFIGVATLRAIGKAQIRPELEVEPLGDLITRVLYRLRFTAEQRPFESVSLNYILPLIFTVLEKGGEGHSSSDEADEQVVLCLEFLSFHTDSCSDSSLPRSSILATLISAMQRYTPHYKLIKECFQDVCRSMAPNISKEELDTVLSGVTVPQTAVRTAVLQAIDAELDLTDLDFSEAIWLACHDDVEENVEIGRSVWEENALDTEENSSFKLISYLESKDKQLRRAAARSLADAISPHTSTLGPVIGKLQDLYREKAKPLVPERDEYGMPRKKDLTDPWEARSGVALAFKELAVIFDSESLVSFFQFMIEDGPLGDRNPDVRDSMVDAATTIITTRGQLRVEELMKLFEQTLEGPDKGSETADLINEAVIILYGALARHLKEGDSRVPQVIGRLLATLSTPSETVQYAVAECLPPLIRAAPSSVPDYVQQMLNQLFQAKKYASRRGAAYGLAGIIKGRGISALREYRILSTLKGGIENKKDANYRQGALLAYELFSLILGRIFEPYVIQIVPQLLSSFGDSNTDVREACLDAAKTCFSNLSSYGVKLILPTLLEGLDEQQWRTKKGACDLLGAMAYLDPQQLAHSLPDIIPPLTNVLNDSHKEVRASANRSLQRFGEVINNPEIKGLVGILLKALSDPTKYTDDALDALIKVSFLHYLDAPSLALVVRILERGLSDRSATKRKSAQIIGSLAHLTERKDLVAHLPILIAGLKIAMVDPVPTTRATASKALGSLVEKLGEDAMPDLIPSLMATLKSDTGAGDRLGSAQGLSEVLAGLGTSRLEETLPTILQNVSSSKPSIREGFMSLFIFLPACFGNSFANYLSKIIPPILSGLADDVESIRDTALRAGRLLVKNFATKAIDLLLPELERGLSDDSYRIRLSSVELVGDLLFNLTGITRKVDTEDDQPEEISPEAQSSLLEVLGEEKRNKILSSLYICRCDTSGLVRTAAINIWKSLVSSPRTLKDLVPTLTQLIIRRLASPNMEQKVIAGNALGELIRKAGEGVLSTLLPTLEEGLQTSTDSDAKQGISIALRELITSASPEALEEYEKTLISVVRTALVDPDEDVREAAAEAFDALQKALGNKAVNQVLPYLLNLLRTEGEEENALSALLTLLTDVTRSNIILPNLIPTLLAPPVSSFNAKALASLSSVAGGAMTRRLPNILNTLMDNSIQCKDEDLREELNSSFDAILLNVDEFDGLNAAMSVLLGLMKADDHRKRAATALRLAKFFSISELDYSRYYQDLIRVLLISFDDRDLEVVKACWSALSGLTQHLRKEEMESLVIPTRQVLQTVGVPGSNLPGFGLPKGINAILPIFLQGLMNGTSDQRTQAALAISDVIDRTSGESLRPFVTQITGPLIRVVSERSVEVKAAILLTLNNLLEKIPTFLKPFLPQLQRTFAKSLADTSSEILRTRAAKALGTLITLTPRIDPLIAELVTGSKTSDPGVKSAMVRALYEVVSKAGANMSEASRNAVLGLIDMDVEEADDGMVITNARLLGAIIKNVSSEHAATLIKSRILTPRFTKASVLGLNSVLLESPQSLMENFPEQTSGIICQGVTAKNTFVADNSVLAAGKYLLSDASPKTFENTKAVFESLAQVIAPGNAIDTRRLALVVIRTVARINNDLVRPHLPLLAPPVFASVRDMVIPIKLSAEGAFVALFSVVDEEGAVFEKYLTGAGADLPANVKRSMGDYFKRVAVRLGSQARERREAEGGQGGLGLSSDELDDEKEVWSVGKMDLGEGQFSDD